MDKFVELKDLGGVAFAGGDPVEMTEEEAKAVLPSFSKEDYRDWLIVDY